MSAIERKLKDFVLKELLNSIKTDNYNTPFEMIGTGDIYGHFYNPLVDGEWAGNVILYDNDYFEGIVHNYDNTCYDDEVDTSDRLVFGIYNNDLAEFVKISDQFVGDPFVFRTVDKNKFYKNEFDNNDYKYLGNYHTIMPYNSNGGWPEVNEGTCEVDLSNKFLNKEELLDLKKRIIEFKENDMFIEIYNKFINRYNDIHDLLLNSYNNGTYEELCNPLGCEYPEELSSMWKVYEDGYCYSIDTAKKVQLNRDMGISYYNLKTNIK